VDSGGACLGGETALLQPLYPSAPRSTRMAAPGLRSRPRLRARRRGRGLAQTLHAQSLVNSAHRALLRTRMPPPTSSAPSNPAIRRALPVAGTEFSLHRPCRLHLQITTIVAPCVTTGAFLLPVETFWAATALYGQSPVEFSYLPWCRSRACIRLVRSIG